MNSSITVRGATSTFSLMETRLSTLAPSPARRAGASCASLGPAYFITACLVIAAILGVFASPARAQSEVIMLTGNTGGADHPLGLPLARLREGAPPGPPL